jgi:hypothetical protein
MLRISDRILAKASENRAIAVFNQALGSRILDKLETFLFTTGQGMWAIIQLGLFDKILWPI